MSSNFMTSILQRRAQIGNEIARVLQADGQAQEPVADAVLQAAKKVEEGKSIAIPLEESGVFPPMVTHMIAVGEESGSLSSLLDKVAEFYEDEVAVMTKGLTALIEPIMIILVGVVVGVMLISLYLPIFTSITTSAGG
jgi:type IV pilus assembly protein PilC